MAQNKKNLSEQIADVMTSSMSNRQKQAALVKIGLPATEAYLLVSSKAWQQNNFGWGAITYGIEVEAYNFDRMSLISEASTHGLQVKSEGYNHEDKHYYKIVSDSSIQGVNSNEVVTPVLQGEQGMNDLKALCNSLVAIDARVNKSCGLHVHIGAVGMSQKHYVRVFKNYQAIETAIDSFMAPSRRGNNSRWCHSLQGIDFSGCTTQTDVARALGYDRYFKCNAEAFSRHQTIEFRQHQGSTDFEKISHWVKFLAALVKYSENHDCPTCNTIEEIPFLTDEEKQFFIRRRAALN